MSAARPGLDTPPAAALDRRAAAALDRRPASTPVVLAVDGGGTKTDAVVLTGDGTLLAHRRGPEMSPQVSGVPTAVERLDALVTGVLADARKTAGGLVALTHGGLYLSGLDLPFEIEDLRAALTGCAWFDNERTIVDNDTFALLRAGTDATEAVAVVCGTGSNCVGRRADGATARFPALGKVSGDWGGGWDLGAHMVWHAARADDGRGPATDLSRAVPTALGAASMVEVIEAVHRGVLDEREYSTLPPLLFALSDAGDAVAQSLVDRQATEIVVFAVAALTRLDLLGVPVPVVLGGGVVAARNARLLVGVEKGLAERAPLASMTLVAERPVVGAALLVLEAAGANPDALTTATTHLHAID